MSYQVIWDPTAEQELAAVWLASADRNGVTAAVAWLDRRLNTDPLQTGESRSSSVHRVAFHEPVGVEYEVIADDNRVIVRAVFAIG